MPDPYPLLPLPESLVRCEGSFAEKIAAHYADCVNYADELAALAARHERLPQELVESCATAQHVEDARRELTDSHIANQRRLVELWTTRAELLRAAGPALRELLADTEGRLESTRDKIAKALRKSGFCPENDPHFHANSAAAEQRFGIQRDQNPEIRALLGRCDELTSAHRLAPPQSAQAQQMADAAGRRLLTTYANLAR